MLAVWASEQKGFSNYSRWGGKYVPNKSLLKSNPVQPHPAIPCMNNQNIHVIFHALNDISNLGHSLNISVEQRGGSLFLLWLKWNFSCVLFYCTFNYWYHRGWRVGKACVQTFTGTLVVMTYGMQDTYIYSIWRVYKYREAGGVS